MMVCGCSLLNKSNWIPLFTFLLYVIFKTWNKTNTLFTAICSSISHVTDQTTNVFKNGFNACDRVIILNKNPSASLNSEDLLVFFSGHANSMAILCLLL
jgi:hypothetical protein